MRLSHTAPGRRTRLLYSDIAGNQGKRLARVIAVNTPVLHSKLPGNSVIVPAQSAEILPDSQHE
jgi:hypothetical protein